MLTATDLPEPVVPAISGAACGRGRRYRIAADVLAQRQRQLGRLPRSLGRQQLAQVHGLALRVGQLDADDVAAGHDRDADGERAHRAGDVVGQADHPARLVPGAGSSS